MNNCWNCIHCEYNPAYDLCGHYCTVQVPDGEEPCFGNTTQIETAWYADEGCLEWEGVTKHHEAELDLLLEGLC